MGCQVNVPVMAVILIATLMSTMSSMAGGLILYFQGLESLEDSMAETSDGELKSLRGKLLEQLHVVESSTSTLKKFVYSHERINTYNSSDWESLIRSFEYAQVSAAATLYSSAMALVPHDWTNRSAFYTAVWGDVLRNGSRELVYGSYNDQLPEDMFVVMEDNSTLKNMTIPSYSLHSDTGYIDKFVYEWDGKSTYVLDQAAYNPRNGPSDIPLPGGGVYTDPPVAGSVMSRWNSPRRWYASDGNMYTYTELEAIYVPPPPPHPWSSYKSVLLYVGFLYQSFQPPFMDYKAERPDTTAMLVDRSSAVVYASTEGGIIPDWCQPQGGGDNTPTDLGCSLNVANLSKAVQAGYRAVAGKPYGTFMKATLDGEEYFLRREDGKHLNLELVWMRPTSSVQGKVQEALVLLIIFTVLVLAFDATVSVLEVVFIALPMRHLATAIAAVGDMETEEAASQVERYESKCIMVAEMRRLMSGMSKTVGRLEEFKAFMPDSILTNHDDDSESHISTKSVSMTRSKSGSISSFSMDSTTVAHTVGTQRALNLHLQTKPVGLLLVNVVGWWKYCSGETDGPGLLSSHTHLATVVMEAMTSNGGSLDNFSGDRFLIGWNTSKPRGDYAQRAAITAFEVSEGLPEHKLSCAIVAGRARVGNTGTKTVRRFSIMSPLVPWVVELEAFNKMRGYLCTTDDQTAARLENSFVYRVVDAMASHKRKVVAPVVQLVERVVVRAAEWMYEIEQAEQGGRDGAVINNFVRSVVKEDWGRIRKAPRAQEILRDLSPDLQEAYAAEAFKPLEMRFDRCQCPSELAGYKVQTTYSAEK
eukprot:TRINITY_DN747_c0_g1_i4.p1 TRINITY_DN747_c0_g1~~TRINITY_DN747_c0_g1_i4.p1  ORF type:complete len:852 (+),score=255.28 TRINITY_DN747_c0_g1_i4:117-2558(+)